MSYTGSVIRTRQAKEAIIEGLYTWVSTGDLQLGWDTMIAHGKRNGAYVAVKIAFVLDFLKALGSK